MQMSALKDISDVENVANNLGNSFNANNNAEMNPSSQTRDSTNNISSGIIILGVTYCNTSFSS